MSLDITKLETLLKDQPDVLAELKTTLATAANATEISNNNAELVKQRKAWEKKESELQATIESTKTTATKKVDPADHNAVLARLESLATELQTERAGRLKSEQDAIDKDISAKIVAHAGESADPEAVLALMRAKGLVGVNEGKTFYHKIDDKGAPMSVEPKDAVESFLAKNTYLRKPSNSQGAGADHGSSPFNKNISADPLQAKKDNIHAAKAAENRIRAGK